MVDTMNLDIIHVRSLLAAMDSELNNCASGNDKTGFKEPDRKRFLDDLAIISSYVQNAQFMDLPTGHPDIKVERVGV